MARSFTAPQKALLRSADLAVNVLVTFYLDEGTYRFCDENASYDLTDGVNTYIGANAFMGEIEIRGSQPLAAEQVRFIVDGNRMAQAGVSDPAAVLAEILEYLHQQRRVDFAFGFRYSYNQTINLVIPAYAGKINSIQLIDGSMDIESGEGTRVVSRLEIVLDSLAVRYRRASHRTRSHNDQLEVDATDQFYSFTQDVALNERTVYWGKAAPVGAGGASGGLHNWLLQYNNNPQPVSSPRRGM